MRVKVYLPDGDAETLIVPADTDPLDTIYDVYGAYLEYAVLSR